MREGTMADAQPGAEEALRRANRALRTIGECSQVLVRATVERQLLEDVCRLVVESGGYRLAWVGYAEQDEARSVKPVARAGIDEGYISSIGVSWADTDRGRGPTGTAIRERRASIARNIQTDPRFAMWREAALQRGYASSIALPLLSDSTQCMGALNIYAAEPDAFDQDEVRLLTQLADDLSYGIRALRDRVARRDAEQLLRRTAETLEHLLDAGPTILYSLGFAEDGTPYGTAVSENLERILGHTPAEALRPGWWRERVHPDDRAAAVAMMGRLLEEEQVAHEFRFEQRDGSYAWIHDERRLVRDDEGRPVEVVGAWTDVTERKQAEAEQARLEAQFLQAQKMESVGRLAGGVAHDFNNMLGVILGHAELAKKRVNPADPLGAHLEGILLAARRSADLTRKLLAFARKQSVAPLVLDLNETVEGMLDMLRRIIGENIHLAWEPAEDLKRVRIDPTQVDQALANLAVNARDAIAGVGTITIGTRNVVLDDDFCADRPGSSPGEYVALVVSDDGCGMERWVLDHLFEPFFTTKEVGRGTGLGLATVYGIVKQNEGFIDVESEPGEGTTLSIYLPPAEGDVQHAPPPPPLQSGRGRGETVLLVEDEAALLRLGESLLQGLGYRVLTAESPRAALRIVESRSEPIHLLVTDVILPEMDGLELARRVMSRQPGVRTLFMSGYAADAIAHGDAPDEGTWFIEKPFSLADFANSVRAALDAKAP